MTARRRPDSAADTGIANHVHGWFRFSGRQVRPASVALGFAMLTDDLVCLGIAGVGADVIASRRLGPGLAPRRINGIDRPSGLLGKRPEADRGKRLASS